VVYWPSYNRSLVSKGEILFAYGFHDIWDDDLARMNENNKGKKYQFPDLFILVIGYIRVYFRLPCRQTEGIIKATGKSLPDHPSYSQICRGVNKLDMSTKWSDDDDGIVINFLLCFYGRFCLVLSCDNISVIHSNNLGDRDRYF
jgi:hypothetical protein